MVPIIAVKMEKAKFSVAYFGSYDPLHPRPRLTIKGLQKNGVEVLECNDRNKNLAIRLKNIALSYWEIRNSTHMIFVCGAGQAYVPLAKFLGILTGKKVVLDAFISYYHVHVKDNKDAGRFSFKAAYFYALDFFGCLLADLVFLDTPEHAEYFQNKFFLSKRKLAVFPVGSDEDVYFPRPRILADKIKVFCISSYYPIHGMEYVIEAARILLPHGNIELWLYGDGPRKREIQKSAENLKNVHFGGRVDPIQLPKIMAEADICLGQFGETEQAGMVVPFKVWDAIAMGKPVITRRNTPLERLFSDREIFYVEAGDPGSLFRAISSLAGDPELRARMAERAYRVYIENGTAERTGWVLAKKLETWIKGIE